MSDDPGPQNQAASDATSQAGFALPSHFGEYDVVGQIGGGGMGIVVKAIHRKLKRPEALKFVRVDRLGQPGAVERFFREMEAAGRLNHPHIVTAYGAGQVAGVPYLAMEYVAGCDLGRLVRHHGPLPWRDACRIAYEVATALEHTEGRGIVHRDLKPSNILLTERGEAKLADLGLARFYRDETGDRLTSADAVVGTVDFVAPEQIDPAQAVDIRADIYSLGCTLYFTLAGRPPFGGREYDSVLRKLRAHTEVVPPSIHDLREDVPAEMAAELARMLEKQPERRYATARALVEALRPFGEGADVARLVREGPAGPESTTRSMQPPTESVSTTQRPRPQIRRRRWMYPAAGVLIAAILVVVVVLIWHPLQREDAGASGTKDRSESGVPETRASPVFEDLSPAEVRPGRWYVLLNRLPEKLLWPADAASRSLLVHDPERGALHLQAYRDAFVALGTIEQKSYTFQVDIARSTWSDGKVGVFLGYQELDGGRRARCQTLEAYRGRSLGKWRLQLERVETVIEKPEGRTVAGLTHMLAGAGVDLPEWASATLEIALRQGKVHHVRWSGKEVADLSERKSGAGAKPGPSAGRFGVFVAAGAADFDHAQIMIEEGR